MKSVFVDTNIIIDFLAARTSVQLINLEIIFTPGYQLNPHICIPNFRDI